MSTPDGARIYRGSLADLRTLMSHPPRLRHGNTYQIPGVAPSADTNYVYQVGDTYWERLIALQFQFAASGAVAARSLTALYQNADGVTFNQFPLIGQVNASETWTVSGDIFDVPPGTPSAGIVGSGSVTGPTAGEVIATTGALAAGRYQVQGLVKLGGTTAGADANNTQLQVGATVIEPIYNPSTTGSSTTFGPLAVDVPAGAAITVNAINNATSTALYAADINATDETGFVAYPQLPDLVLKPEWQITVQIGNGQTGDQISGIQLLIERYPSDYASGTLGLDREALIDLLIGR